MSSRPEAESAFVHPPWMAPSTVRKFTNHRAVPAIGEFGTMHRCLTETRDRIAETQSLLTRSDALIAYFHRALMF